MSGKPETEFIKQVRDYLALRGCVTTRVNAGLTVTGSCEDGNRRVIRGAKAGTADIIGCYNGRYFAIEAKVGKNKPSAAQAAFLETVRQAGGIAFAAWSLDDVDTGMGWTAYRT